MGVARRLLSRLIWPDAVAFADTRTVVCHEWFTTVGGSDKVAAELASVSGAGVVYTFALQPECVTAVGVPCPVVTWRLGRWAGRSGRFKPLLPIMPVVWWALDLDRAQLVLTSSHAFVNAVRTPAARRLSYCHTPMRYAWAWRLEQGRMPRRARWVMRPAAAILRRIDRRCARHVDEYIANSQFVASRIRRAYGRDARVIHPPVDTAAFTGELVDAVARRSFVSAGRLVPYKRHDLAIAAATLARAPLVVAGGGPDLDRLRSMAGPTVTFDVDPSDVRLRELLANAKALLFCGIEDFGMLPVEAQACGTPVIARAEGGALETVEAGETGILIDSDRAGEWGDALAAFDVAAFDPAVIRAAAARFDTSVFRDAMATLIQGGSTR